MVPPSGWNVGEVSTTSASLVKAWPRTLSSVSTVRTTSPVSAESTTRVRDWSITSSPRRADSSIERGTSRTTMYSPSGLARKLLAANLSFCFEGSAKRA